VIDVRASIHGRVERIQLTCPQRYPSVRGAEQYERLVLAELHAGRDPRAREEEATEFAPTVGDYAATYLREHSVSRGLRASTVKSKRLALDVWIIPTVGSRSITDVRTADFTKLRSAMMDAGRSGKTTNNTLVVFSALVRFWYGQHDRPCPPFKVGLVKLSKADRAPFFPKDVLDRLAGEARGISPASLVQLLLGADAGLRMSEIRALRWRDLQLKGRPVVHVARTRDYGKDEDAEDEDAEEDDGHSRKSWRSCTVPLSDRLVRAARGSPAAPPRRAPVPRRRGAAHHAPDGGASVRGVLRASSVKAGTFHWLRHTFCTLLAARGVNPRVIQELAVTKTSPRPCGTCTSCAEPPTTPSGRSAGRRVVTSW
jgi:integrase